MQIHMSLCKWLNDYLDVQFSPSNLLHGFLRVRTSSKLTGLQWLDSPVQLYHGASWPVVSSQVGGPVGGHPVLAGGHEGTT